MAGDLYAHTGALSTLTRGRPPIGTRHGTLTTTSTPTTTHGAISTEHTPTAASLARGIPHILSHNRHNNPGNRSPGPFGSWCPLCASRAATIAAVEGGRGLRRIAFGGAGRLPTGARSTSFAKAKAPAGQAGVVSRVARSGDRDKSKKAAPTGAGRLRARRSRRGHRTSIGMEKGKTRTVGLTR